MTDAPDSRSPRTRPTRSPADAGPPTSASAATGSAPDSAPGSALGAATGKGLAAGTLGTAGSVVIGLASTAPVYSLAATLGFVVLAVGAQAPIAFILAFIPMLFVAFAYRELNREIPDCGTSFTWATKAFGPWVGWMAGWGVAVAGIVVLANLAQVAGTYLWLLVGDGSLAENDVLVTATGVFFIAAMTYVSYRGLEIGEKLQVVLLVIQYAALALFAVLAIASVVNGTAPDPTLPTLDWFNPFAFADATGFTEAILLALFIYWGWDACLALNEETKDPRRIPGRSAIISTVILLVTYVGVAVAAMMYAGVGESGTGLANPDGSDDVFFALKDALFGPWAWLLVVAVLVSAVSSTQTTILPTARGTLSMAVYKALPARFSVVHPRFKTPSFSTLVMGAASIAYYVIMTAVSSNILADSILSLGLAIAFYYAITGFACVWYFRRNLFDSAHNVFFRFLFPLLGAVLLTAAFVKSAIDMVSVDYGYSTLLGIGGTFVVGIGSLAIGLVLAIIWWAFPGSKRFFRGESLNRETPVLVPDSPDLTAPPAATARNARPARPEGK